MTGTKLVIIVLVIIAVLFVVLMVWGTGNNQQGSPNKQDTQAAQQDPNQTRHPAFFEGFNDLLGSQGPKVDATQLRPSLTTFDLQPRSSFSIAVLADSDHPIRQAKVSIQTPTVQRPNASCAQVIFTPSAGSPAPFDQPQDSYGKDAKVKDRTKFTVTVGKGGGTLVIKPSPDYTAPCTVRLE